MLTFRALKGKTQYLISAPSMFHLIGPISSLLKICKPIFQIIVFYSEQYLCALGPNTSQRMHSKQIAKWHATCSATARNPKDPSGVLGTLAPWDARGVPAGSLGYLSVPLASTRDAAMPEYIIYISPGLLHRTAPQPKVKSQGREPPPQKNLKRVFWHTVLSKTFKRAACTSIHFYCIYCFNTEAAPFEICPLPTHVSCSLANFWLAKARCSYILYYS